MHNVLIQSRYQLAFWALALVIAQIIADKMTKRKRQNDSVLLSHLHQVNLICKETNIICKRIDFLRKRWIRSAERLIWDAKLSSFHSHFLTPNFTSLYSEYLKQKKKKKKSWYFVQNDTKLLATNTGNLDTLASRGRKNAHSPRQSGTPEELQMSLRCFPVIRWNAPRPLMANGLDRFSRLVRLSDPSFVISGREIPIFFSTAKHNADSSTV